MNETSGENGMSFFRMYFFFIQWYPIVSSVNWDERVVQFEKGIYKSTKVFVGSFIYSDSV